LISPQTTLTFRIPVSHTLPGRTYSPYPKPGKECAQCSVNGESCQRKMPHRTTDYEEQFNINGGRKTRLRMKCGEGPYYCQQNACAMAGLGVLINIRFHILYLVRGTGRNWSGLTFRFATFLSLPIPLHKHPRWRTCAHSLSYAKARCSNDLNTELGARTPTLYMPHSWMAHQNQIVNFA